MSLFDVCAVVVTTDGRINGSLWFVLVVGPFALDPPFSFGVTSLSPGCELLLVDAELVSFEAALETLLLSFVLVNSTVATSTSFDSETATCEGARLSSMSRHVYSSFNFGGLPSLQKISPNVIFAHVSEVQNLGGPLSQDTGLSSFGNWAAEFDAIVAPLHISEDSDLSV